MMKLMSRLKKEKVEERNDCWKRKRFQMKERKKDQQQQQQHQQLHLQHQRDLSLLLLPIFLTPTQEENLVFSISFFFSSSFSFWSFFFFLFFYSFFFLFDPQKKQKQNKRRKEKNFFETRSVGWRRIAPRIFPITSRFKWSPFNKRESHHFQVFFFFVFWSREREEKGRREKEKEKKGNFEFDSFFFLFLFSFSFFSLFFLFSFESMPSTRQRSILCHLIEKNKPFSGEKDDKYSSAVVQNFKPKLFESLDRWVASSASSSSPLLSEENLKGLKDFLSKDFETIVSKEQVVLLFQCGFVLSNFWKI